MRDVVRLGVVAFVYAASLASPCPGYGQTVTSADVVGTWRSVHVLVDWDSSTGISARPLERRLTLRADGTFATQARSLADSGKVVTEEWRLLGNTLQPRGRWSLASDTLVVDYLPGDTLVPSINNPRWDPKLNVQVGDTVWRNRRTTPFPSSPYRYKLAREGAKLIVQWLGRGAVGPGAPEEFARVDTTQPLPTLALPPATLKRADLVGVWATTTDTVVLRADSTWAANARGFDGTGEWVISGCGIVPPSPTVRESNAGTWYLLPGDVVLLVDQFQQKMCSMGGAAPKWRGGEVQLHDQRLVVGPPYSMYLVYTRIRASTP